MRERYAVELSALTHVEVPTAIPSDAEAKLILDRRSPINIAII